MEKSTPSASANTLRITPSTRTAPMHAPGAAHTVLAKAAKRQLQDNRERAGRYEEIAHEGYQSLSGNLRNDAEHGDGHDGLISHRLAADDLSIGYNGKPVLEHLTLDVLSGEVTCLLGPNGVGKTTLFRTLLGFLPIISGEVTVDGVKRDELSRRDFAQHVAYVPQIHNPPFAFTVIDMVLTGAVSHLGSFATPSRGEYDEADRILDDLGIKFLKDRIYTELSGGEQQMTLIARALMQNSNILIMDEPTASLDFGNQVSVLDQVKRLAEGDHGVIMTTHNPDHCFLCGTKVILIGHDKKVITGTVDEVVTEEHLSSAYQIDCRIAETTDRHGKKLKTCIPLLD